ncbi:hypothetical protein KM043_010941 [Ampulex compressa]|nr:hypothetical protein KM043_010941 [Ampulex compressa]
MTDEDRRLEILDFQIDDEEDRRLEILDFQIDDEEDRGLEILDFQIDDEEDRLYSRDRIGRLDVKQARHCITTTILVNRASEQALRESLLTVNMEFQLCEIV